MGTVGTDPWLEAFAAALTAADLDPGPVRIVVRHRIVDGPAWTVRVDQGGITVARADDTDDTDDNSNDDADVTFTWQADDAAAVAAGELGPLVPFQAGRLRVGGDLSRLSEAAELFARLPRVGAGSGRA